MEPTGRPIPKRRTLLQRGLALLGGAFGGAIASREAQAAPLGSAEVTLRLIGSRRPAVRVAKGLGAASHLVCSGDLLSGPGGETVGAFHTNGLCLETSLGSRLAAPSNIAFQSFTLPDGSLFGVGPGPAAGGERTCALLGGTGRFAGARGSYVERASPSASQGRDTVEFVFAFKA